MKKSNKLWIAIIVIIIIFVINPALLILLSIVYFFVSKMFSDFNNIVKDMIKNIINNSNILWSNQNFSKKVNNSIKDYRKKLVKKENINTTDNMEVIKESNSNYEKNKNKFTNWFNLFWKDKKDDLKTSEESNLDKKKDKISFGTWFNFDENKFFKK